MRFLSTVLIDALLFMAISAFFPSSLYVANVEMAVVAAFVLGLLNWLVKPIVSLLSLPINLLTLGLFGLVINGAMLELTAKLVGSGFQFSSFWAAMLIAILMTIVSAIIAAHFDKSDE